MEIQKWREGESNGDIKANRKSKVFVRFEFLEFYYLLETGVRRDLRGQALAR